MYLLLSAKTLPGLHQQVVKELDLDDVAARIVHEEEVHEHVGPAACGGLLHVREPVLDPYDGDARVTAELLDRVTKRPVVFE